MKPGEANKLVIFQTLQTLFGAELVVCEYRFHAVRRWRFDYSIPEIKLAVEYHGHSGFVGKGASGHSTIKGLTNDSEKGNSAISHGWRVLAFTALHFAHKDRVKHNLTDVRSTILEAIAGMQNESITLHYEKIKRLEKAGIEIIEAARRSLPRPHPTIERNAKLFIPENDQALLPIP